MTFQSLLTILACSLICLEAVSRAFAAGPAASHTTITNTIDIMGAVESAQENNPRGYGGQNIYSRKVKAEKVTSSASKISEVDHQLASPDIPSSSKAFFSDPAPKSRSATETQADAADHSGLSYSSYITTSSGPTISISSNGPNAHTISYYAPGGVFLSHGYPGSSYVLNAHHLPPQPPAVYSSSFNPRGNYAKSDYANSAAPRRIEIPEMSTSSSLPYSDLRNVPATVSAGIPERRYVLHSYPNSKIVISSGVDPDPPSMQMNLFAGADPATTTSGIYGYIGHPAYAAAYRNLEATRHILDGISSAVSRAVNINLAQFGEAALQ